MNIATSTDPIMASQLHIHLPFLQLFLVFLSISLVQSVPANYIEGDRVEDDFMGWISWNMNDYKTRSAAAAAAIQAAAEESGWLVDPKLASAEAAKVTYIVSQDGGGDFRSIREALDTIKPKNSRRVVILITPGIYWEKIVIPKSKAFITFLGDPSSPPVITGNDTASTIGDDGARMKTFHSATVAVNSAYFKAFNIKFENTATATEGQAVALRISGDKAAFYNCSFSGEQDTLYDHKGLHYFQSCFIQGSVDFIFGYGRSLYQDCTLNSVGGRHSAVTAQKRTKATMESGFSFVRSNVTGTGPQIYLGRAWGNRARVVFSYAFMDKLVAPEGWNGWGVRSPQTSGIFFGEYNCSGPGADWAGRVPWAQLLTEEEAQPFLGTYYVYGDSWLL